jgi:chorismate synthase
MPGNSFGTLFRITTFGESHGPGIGVTIDGVPPGLPLTLGEIQSRLDRRKPGQSDVSTPRKELDRAELLSGVFRDTTTGAPLSIFIRNERQRSGDYDALSRIYRPGHADYTYRAKYGLRDWRGGGRSSGRETAARVAAGAVAEKVLSREGIEIVAYTLRAAGISCNRRNLEEIEANPMRACDGEAAQKMRRRILELSEAGDSAGGILECSLRGLPAGLGEPVFHKTDALLAQAMLSLGAVKGIEFGAGFTAADMTGSEHNDAMGPQGFLSNHAGGILGGITTGEELLFRLAVKPTASIAREQRTIDTAGEPQRIAIEGRHDPCILPRLVPVVEAMTAIVMADLLLQHRALTGRAP